MKKVSNYTIVRGYFTKWAGDKETTIDEKVDKRVKEGWQPWGNLCLIHGQTTRDIPGKPNEPGRIIGYQAMVKYEMDTEPTPE